MNVREWALPVYTVLIQLSVGALFILWVIRARSGKSQDANDMDRIFRGPVLVILLTIILAMIGSHFHLSRPYLSFLAVLNFQSSWLSREIVFTILFFLSCGVLAYLLWFRQGHTRPERRDWLVFDPVRLYQYPVHVQPVSDPCPTLLEQADHDPVILCYGPHPGRDCSRYVHGHGHGPGRYAGGILR
jgi:hypothetical protein